MSSSIRRTTSTAFAFLLVGVLVLGSAVSTPADAARRHLQLVKSAPVADGVFSTAPTAIMLWFSEPVELGVTRVRLEGPDAKLVTLDPPRLETADGDPRVVARIPSALANGAYTVRWSTASKDGHVVKGTISFTLSGR